ncbi:hypothetical protein HDU97_002562 [Phlyctochytrium planicorne]|nr:hypothetical protein HDU97_002562 [Phlyctochytrium planicorne]
MSAVAHRTFLGFRVWPASILKVYFPFVLSGSTIFFLFSGAHTAMSNDSHDKWRNIVNNVREDSKYQAKKNAAAAWYEEHINKKEASDAKKH